MKYIRTRGEIIDTSDWKAHFLKKGDEYVLEGYTANFNLLMGVLAEDIIAEADTIEELCDYFSFDNAFEYANPSLYAFASTARLRAKNHENLIGYIVIEKNGVKALEPVAKTNDEWEFELL